MLLLRRSARVRTYRGLWAGVSGSLDAGRSPIEQAIQEIEEETSLSNADASPVLAGRPFGFVDDELSRRWVVHPFRFKVSDDASIELNWEHLEAKWVEAAEMNRLSTVPSLFDAWSRVALLPGWIEAALDAIRENRSAGAAELARQALDALGSAAQQYQTYSPTDLANLLDRTAGALRLVRPTMTPIGYWASRFHAGLVEAHANFPDLPALRSAVKSLVKGQGLNIEADQLGDRLADDIADSLSDGDVVLTASYSSSLVNGFARAAGQGKRVRVLALASGRETPSFGRRTADAVRSAGLGASVVPDEELPAAVERADLVLIGADSVLPDGSVVNGAPSGQLVEYAHSAGLPVIVAAGPTKRLAATDPTLALLRAGRLETGFDLVPADLIDVIL